MKHFLLGLVTAAALGGVVLLSRSDSPLDARAPADPSELKPIYADIAAFTRRYLQQA